MICAAIIGCGLIAEEHLRAIAQLDGIQAVAYCDIDQQRATAMLDKYGGRYATDDGNRVFADDGIDVVYICTLHDTHANLAIRACRAGRHVMLEKPMALTVAECNAIGEAVEQSGVTLMTAFKLRYYPLVQRAREFITSPIISIAQVMDTRWPDEYWGQHPTKGGGNVLSQGCHAVDLLCYLNRSEPVTVFAEGGSFTHRDQTVIDNMVATIRFANGRIASFALGDSGTTPYVSKWSFQLVDGVKSVHLHDRLKRGVFYDGENTTTFADEEELGMLEENRQLVLSLQNNTAPPTTWRDGLRATLVLREAFEAVRTGEAREL